MLPEGVGDVGVLMDAREEVGVRPAGEHHHILAVVEGVLSRHRGVRGVVLRGCMKDIFHIN